MQKKIRHIIEDTFLVALILLNIFDFFHLLPGDLDYIKKIISWTLIAYLFYKLDIPRILFGAGEKSQTHHDINVLIIISYLLLAFKKFTASIIMLPEESLMFRGFFEFIRANAAIMEMFTFIMGSTVLLALSCYMAVRCDIGKKSFMGIIYEAGEAPRHIGKVLVRGITIFLVLTSFFILLFDFVIEWLAIAVDAPLAMFAIFFYLFYIIRRHKKWDAQSFLYKMGNFGEDFYRRFISLFFERKTVFTAVTGILVLHLLSDIGSFIIPFITGFFKPVYFQFVDPSLHQNIYSLMVSDLSISYSILARLAVIGTYFLNIIAIILLLFLPAYIWYKLFRKEQITVSRIWLALFFASFSAILISPVFKLTSLYMPWIVGVDIQTSNAVYPAAAAVTALAIFGFAMLASLFPLAKRILIVLFLLIMNIFFASYVYYFFISIAKYYIQAVIFLAERSQYVTAFYFLIFFSIIMIFYFTGLYSFVKMSLRESRNITLRSS